MIVSALQAFKPAIVPISLALALPAAPAFLVFERLLELLDVLLEVVLLFVEFLDVVAGGEGEARELPLDVTDVLVRVHAAAGVTAVAGRGRAGEEVWTWRWEIHTAAWTWWRWRWRWWRRAGCWCWSEAAAAAKGWWGRRWRWRRAWSNCTTAEWRAWWRWRTVMGLIDDDWRSVGLDEGWWWWRKSRKCNNCDPWNDSLDPWRGLAFVFNVEAHGERRGDQRPAGIGGVGVTGRVS